MYLLVEFFRVLDRSELVAVAVERSIDRWSTHVRLDRRCPGVGVAPSDGNDLFGREN